MSRLAHRHEGKPSYRVQPSDLVPAVGTCPTCGGPKPILIPRIPEGEGGSWFQGAPNYDAIAGFQRHILPYANEYPCSRCELLMHVRRLFPPVGRPPFETDMQGELRRLRQTLLPPAKPESALHFPAELFGVGEVFTTPRAGLALLKLKRPDLNPTIGGVHELGYEFVPEYLERHAIGNFGGHGQFAYADVEQGCTRHVLAPISDQNAASIANDKGPVHSDYLLDVFNTPQSRLIVWSELESPALTLVATPDDLTP